MPLFPADAPSVAVSSTAIEADDIVLAVARPVVVGRPRRSARSPAACSRAQATALFVERRAAVGALGVGGDERRWAAVVVGSGRVVGGGVAVPAPPAWTEEERALLSEWAEARGYGNPLSVVWRPPQLPAHKIDAFRCGPRHKPG